jgi:hypothetical protein
MHVHRGTIGAREHARQRAGTVVLLLTRAVPDATWMDTGTCRTLREAAKPTAAWAARPVRLAYNLYFFFVNE